MYFGNQPDPPPGLPYDQFIDVVKALGPGTDRTPNLSAVTLSEGIVTVAGDKVTKKRADLWKVHPADVVFRVECKIPVTMLIYGDGHKTATVTDAKANPFYARQMHTKTPWNTTLNVTIQSDKESLNPVDEENLWRPVAITRQMPMAVWGKCT